MKILILSQEITSQSDCPTDYTFTYYKKGWACGKCYPQEGCKDDISADWMGSSVQQSCPSDSHVVKMNLKCSDGYMWKCEKNTTTSVATPPTTSTATSESTSTETTTGSTTQATTPALTTEAK